MSILEKIRNRTGLLVGLVGLALVIFILESLLGSGSALFTSENNTVASIAGETVDAKKYSDLVNEQIFMIQKNNPNATIDDKTRQQIIEQVWNTLINDKVIKKEHDKLGVITSEDELYDAMLINPHSFLTQQLTNQQTGKVYDELAKPDGTLDPVKLFGWVNNMKDPNQESFWKSLEQAVSQLRTSEKYYALVKKGVYVTQAEAKAAYVAQNKQVNVNFVMKRYTSTSDSTIKVSDEDIQKYYNDHQYEYKVTETTRKVEYVAFDVIPSNEDLDALQKDMQRVADEFKTKTAKEDSSYIAQENENGEIAISSYSKKNMIITDSSVYTAPNGTVFGPYTEGALLKVYKLIETKSIADSAKVRHILIGTTSRDNKPRTKEQAKRTADSLIVLLKSGKEKFDSLVTKISDDKGSIEKGGDYGWFDENIGFVDPFKNAGLEGTKGNLSAVETQFGYHIIEVLDVAKTRHTKYKIAQITRAISPSSGTTEVYYKKASDFAGKNTTAELFEKAIDSEKLNKRLADNIKESDRNLPGLEGAKELVRWVYEAKKGDVSSVFDFKDRFVIAHLVGIKEKGTAPLDEVKDDVTTKVKREKKAEEFIKEFQTKAGSAKSIDDIASKLGLQVEKAENITFGSYSVPGVGREDALIGTASVTKMGATTKAIKGNNGVFVLHVASINEAQAPKDYKMQQKQTEQALTGRVDYEVDNALKEKANIEDHRGRFDF